VPASAVDNLYERDYYAWTEEQVRLLRLGRTVNLDLVNLAEEIEGKFPSEKSS
jgi:hypothetical protein